jgi:DNA mismatch repair ATPase MutS
MFIRVEQLKLSEYMRIDSRTLVGLNLVEDPSQPGHSVFDILNRTRTPGGCRLLNSWVKQPLIQVSYPVVKPLFTR